MFKRLIAVVVVSLLTGCFSSVNEKMKKTTDELLAQYASASQRSEPEPSSYVPMEWEAGQWMVYRTIDTKTQQPSVTRLSVLEKSDEGIWFESETWSYQSHSIAKTLYARIPRTSEEAVDVIKKIITRTDDGEPQVMDFTQPNPMMDMMKGMMRQYAQRAISPEDIRLDGKTDVTVAAGTFAATGQYTSTVSYPGGSVTMTSWFHPAVPINGMVKATSADGQYVMELLDYGTSGARSALK